jgi:hypothetical protein
MKTVFISSRIKKGREPRVKNVTLGRTWRKKDKRKD